MNSEILLKWRNHLFKIFSYLLRGKQTDSVWIQAVYKLYLKLTARE
jgi:hypothetical protein